ncbi:hypothetical protein FB639_003208, partial [Coemansia asiatica]
MFGFLRTAFSTKILRPFTAPHHHQPAAVAEAARGMKVRSSVKLMCDKCSFVHMDLVAGKPVFLEEIVASESAFNGQSVRVTGTLHSYSPALESAVLVEGQSALIVDTKLLGVV